MTFDEQEMESLVPAGTEKQAASGADHRVDDDVATQRPRTVTELLDLATDILRMRFFACVGVAILVWVPGRVLHFMYLNDLMQGVDGENAMLFAIAVETVLNGFQSLLAVALVAIVTHATLSGTWISGWGALSVALRRSMILLAAAIMVGIAKIVGSFLCCLPGLFVMYRMLFSQIVAVVEPVGPWEAMTRSWDLTRGGFQPFLRWFVLGLVGVLAVFPINLLSGAFDYSTVMDDFSDKIGSPPAIVTQAFAFLISTVFLAFGTAVWSSIVTVYYADCRMRRDGMDLEAWLERIEAAHPVTLAPVAPSDRGLA